MNKKLEVRVARCCAYKDKKDKKETIMDNTSMSYNALTVGELINVLKKYKP